MPPTRPHLRPTLSRKTKYVTIAPNAERKLGKEARRKEHDLRRLVGHANFLDTLMGELGISSDEEENNEPVQPEKEAAAHDETPQPEITITEPEEAREEHWTDAIPPELELEAEEVWSSDSDDDDDGELVSSDDEDDEDHALTRTPSHVKVRIADIDSDTPVVEHVGPMSIITVNEHKQGLTIAEHIQSKRKGGIQISLVEIINDIEYDRSDRLTPSAIQPTKAVDAPIDYFGMAPAVAAV